MTIRRHFLDWARPVLPAAADYLIERFSDSALVDLSGVVIVLPGGRAGRRLEEILVERVEAAGLRLAPPEIATVGRLPELLYVPKRPLASEFTQRAAWVKVLRGATSDSLKPLIPRLPEENNVLSWLSLGALLAKQHQLLAADGLDFGDVVEQIEKLGAEHEARQELNRWRTLKRLQTDYLTLLDELELWDRQTARLVAGRYREYQAEKQIILLGTVDLNRAMRDMLEQVADHVTALIHAPESRSKDFDSLGCLLPDRWANVELAIDDDRIHQADDAVDQADMALRCLASYEQRYRADEITIGLPDERLVPQVLRQMAACEVSARWGPGSPLLQSAPCRLLRGIADHIERGTYATLAALVRQPDLFAYLEQESEHHGEGEQWLTVLDRYERQHLQSELSSATLKNPNELGRLKSALEKIEKLLAPLSGKSRSLEAWAEMIFQLLEAVYTAADDNAGVSAANKNQLAYEMEILVRAMDEHATVPAKLDIKCSGADAIRIFLDMIGGAGVPAAEDPQAVELLGWLELSLDDRPAVVVTTMNEGYVPSSVGADLFLPNSLRGRLGLEDNARRYARDAYAAMAILASRSDVDFIVAKRDLQSNPLLPSRLVLATDAASLPARTLAMIGPLASRESRPPLKSRWQPPSEESRFQIPRPTPLTHPITQLSVTSFRAYLDCPYRFYLQHVLKLDQLDDRASELDGMAFGSLMHDVLQEFGQSDMKDSTRSDEIGAFFEHSLSDLYQQRYSPSSTGAVRLQLEQLRGRLSAFAVVQAARAAAGWCIEYVESPGQTTRVEYTVDGLPITISGRIDRIDRHSETGKRIVLDYKSSDSGSSPDKSHRKRAEWIDLQLPLYRHLVKGLDIDGPVDLGYIVLPRDTEKTGFLIAKWPKEELAQADKALEHVVRSVREEVFWPPNRSPSLFADHLAAICQARVFDQDSVLTAKGETA